MSLKQLLQDKKRWKSTCELIAMLNIKCWWKLTNKFQKKFKRTSEKTKSYSAKVKQIVKKIVHNPVITKGNNHHRNDEIMKSRRQNIKELSEEEIYYPEGHIRRDEKQMVKPITRNAISMPIRKLKIG